MTILNQIYKCNVCGNMVEMVHTGIGTLVCCGQPMEFLTENNQDERKEKHVPIIEKTEKGVIIKVGSVPHPMEDKHFIEWVEIIANGKIDRVFLHPGNKPEIEFCVKAENVTARIYCNIHGLWKS